MKLSDAAKLATAPVWSALLCALVSVSAFAEQQEPLSPPVAFRFGGGEKIKLIVVPESVGASIEQIVSDDGLIALPTGGEPLNIKNKSRFEAQKLAAERIQRDSGVLKASADIALLSVPARSVYIGGEGVRMSQSIPIMGSGPLTLYAAILAAGGVSADGDPTRVSVSRTASNGQVTSEVYDVSGFGDPSSRTLGPLLESGDVVKVPRGEVFILAGEVMKAGPLNRRELALRSERFPRVSSAIYATGGLKPGANRKNIKVIRQSKTGGRQVLSVDLDAAEKTSGTSAGDAPSGTVSMQTNGQATGQTSGNSTAASTGATDADPILQDGDVVVVGTTGGIPVLGKVRVPGVYPINGQSIKLSRVIATAGGFAEFAKPSSVIIVKANNPYGMIHVDMSLIQKGGFQDVDLEEGDLVYVPERLL